MVSWGDLLRFVTEVVYDDGCNSTLSHTKKFCDKNRLDFKEIRSRLDLLTAVYHSNICDCIIYEESDRFTDWSQDITEKPDLELGIFWTNLFGFLKAKLNPQRHPVIRGEYKMSCTGSFKFTEEFCALNNLNKGKILSTLRMANARSCDCEVVSNAKRHFEDDALIGSPPTINLDDMQNPNWEYPERGGIGAFKK